MMNRLRGHSLAHPGCLVGVTVGVTLGLILAGVMTISFNVALTLALFTWLALTVGLGAIGWIIGVRLTPRFAALESEEGSQGEES